MTSEELRNLCTYWQKTLRLQDVDVKVRFAELGEIDCYGDCTMSKDFTQANIRVQPIAFLSKNTLHNPDEEVTLVHELIHVLQRYFANSHEVTKACKKNKTLNQAMELYIERTAEALVSLRRASQEKAVE